MSRGAVTGTPITSDVITCLIQPHTLTRQVVTVSDRDPAWEGPLAEFVGSDVDEHATVPVRAFTSSIGVDGGEH